MNTIVYGNSYSKINGLTDIEMKSLRKELSYHVDFAAARFIPNPANRIKYCIDLKGNFATGLLPRVKRHLDKSGIKYAVDSTRIDLTAPKQVFRAFKSENRATPYPDQTNALRALQMQRRGVCSMPTGTGKSQVITMLVEATKLKTLIVVPTLELKSQLTTSLSAALTSMEGITVENIDSSALKKATDYDCLIIDECHRAAAQTYRNLNKTAWSGIRYRYSFSATPFRNDIEEQLLYEGIAGDVVFELSYSDSVKKGYIVPVEAYYYELPKSTTDGYTYAQVYKDLVVNNGARNMLIAEMLTNLYTNNKHCLCLVREVEHGLILSEMTGIPFSNGADDDSRQWIETFKSGKLKCLIATEGLLGEGVDTKPCEYVIIAGLGKARSAFMQRVGRCVRKYGDKISGKVILFKDKSHRFVLSSFNTHVKILKTEYNTQIIKLETE